MTPGPLVVGVAELLRHPGTQREVRVTGEVPDLAISSAKVVDGGEVEGRFTLEAMSDHAVTAKGTITAPWVGECRRCLRTIEGRLQVDVEEVFDTRPVEDEMYPLAGDRLDLEPLLRDAVLLSLPLAPVCDDACAGPDPDKHPISVDEPEGFDPRWSALREMKFE